MSERDIVDRLQEIADLKPGDAMPEWLWNNPDWATGEWATGMSKLLNEAITEIKRWRRAAGRE